MKEEMMKNAKDIYIKQQNKVADIAVKTVKKKFVHQLIYSITNGALYFNSAALVGFIENPTKFKKIFMIDNGILSDEDIKNYIMQSSIIDHTVDTNIFSMRDETYFYFNVRGCRVKYELTFSSTEGDRVTNFPLIVFTIVGGKKKEETLNYLKNFIIKLSRRINEYTTRKKELYIRFIPGPTKIEQVKSRNSVCIEDSILDKIDMITYSHDKMLNNIKKYGLNMSTGILLYGEPGCGKSTLAKYIAHKLDATLCLVDIGSERLSNMIEINDYLTIGQTNVLLIEDIDTIVTDRNDNKKISDKRRFNNLLQLLDGVSTIENCIIIATTNHIEKLDPALIREGRFDYKFEIKPATKELADKMCKSFNVTLESIENEYEVEYPINQAKLQSYILDQMRNALLNDSSSKDISCIKKEISKVGNTTMNGQVPTNIPVEYPKGYV